MKTKTATFEIVDEADNLGQKLTFEDRTEKAINARITKAWSKYWSLKEHLKSRLQELPKEFRYSICASSRH